MSGVPTYAYACRSCGHRFDAVQSMNDAPLEACIDCGGPVRRVIAPVGVAFKGSGFYRNDSRSGPGAGPSGAASGGGPGDSAKPSSVSDS